MSFWIGLGIGIPIGILMYAAGSVTGAYLKTRTENPKPYGSNAHLADDKWRGKP